MSEVTHHLQISGMTCGGCSGRVQRVLAGTEGVLSAEISHENDSGVVVTTSSLSTQQVVEIVEGCGFKASSQ